MRLGRMTSNQSFTWTCTNQITSWLVHSWSTFGARMTHGQIQIHKIHHGPDLGEATTFPLIIYFVPGHGTSTQMSFCPGTPTWESNSHNRDSHNFVCRPPIKMRSEAELQASSRAFQWYVARHFHARKLGPFVTFDGCESNYQFDSRPFFWP